MCVGRYVDPTHPDFKGPAFSAQPYLVPIATSTPSKASGLRATIFDYLTEAKVSKSSTLTLEQTKECNRAAERARELALEEKKEERAAKKDTVMFKLLMRFGKKAGIDLSDSDDDER